MTDTVCFNEGRPASARAYVRGAKGVLHPTRDEDYRQGPKWVGGQGLSLCGPGPYNNNGVKNKQGWQREDRNGRQSIHATINPSDTARSRSTLRFGVTLGRPPLQASCFG